MMKHLRLLVLATLVAMQAASLAAQSSMPTMAPAAMPPSDSAMPISAGGLVEPGYGPAQTGYSDVEYGGYCGDGYCEDGGDCRQGLGGGRLLCLTGRGYLQVDAMLLNRNDGPPTPMVLNASGDTVISGNSPWFGFETLPRITAGYVLPNDTAVEATVFYKDDFDSRFGVSGAGLTIQDPQNNLDPNNSFTNTHLALSTSIHNYEVNLVETGRIFNCLAGFRYLEIQDTMQLWANGGANNFASAINTYNSMIGGQTGGRFSVSKGLFTWEGTGKAGLFYNNGHANSSVTSNTLGTVTQRSEGGCESFVGDLGTTLTFRPSAAVAFRAGYQIMWINRTGLAPNQINPNDPYPAQAFFNDHGNLVLHGPSVGADVRW